MQKLDNKGVRKAFSLTPHRLFSKLLRLSSCRGNNMQTLEIYFSHGMSGLREKWDDAGLTAFDWNFWRRPTSCGGAFPGRCFRLSWANEHSTSGTDTGAPRLLLRRRRDLDSRTQSPLREFVLRACQEAVAFVVSHPFHDETVEWVGHEADSSPDPTLLPL